ncbi:MAG TPA: hypothetical protein VK543_17610 [Puia sp.]|nr:hypothetical protein [Puia sp.]
MISLIDLIQKNLGYQELHKIDPNTQDIKLDEGKFGIQSVTQAAIPAVICGLYNLLKTAEGAELLLDTESTNWLDSIFGKKKDELIKRIAAYSNTSIAAAQLETEHIANEAVRLLKENITDKANQQAIGQFAAEQRTQALLYLPASLQLGDLLNDNQLDDRTHKMEGPISSLMHAVEKQF